MMKSLNVKHSISILGHRTCIILEDPFWELLKEIAQKQGLTRPGLIARIDADREHGNLSSAIRLFVLGYVRDQAEAEARQSGQSSKRVNGPKAIEAA